MRPSTLAVLFALSLPTLAHAETPTGDFYEVSTEGSSKTLKAGDKGRVVIAFHLKPGAHMSDEAPLKIELASAESHLDKATLSLADSVVHGADPRFEVGFAPAAQGLTTITAKMTFFVCTDKRCLRQTHHLSLPVEVQ